MIPFTLLSDPVPPPRRRDCTSKVAALEEKAEELRDDADALRRQAAECENRASDLQRSANVLRYDGILTEAVILFICEAEETRRLDWYEREMLRQAIALKEYDPRELIHLGLLHALPVPMELFPAMPERRAA